MTEQRVSIRLSRKVSMASEGGKAISWVRDTYDDSAPDMFISAIRVLYLPLALAEAGESEDVVHQAIKKSRSIFEERMRAALEPYLKAEEGGSSRNGNAHFLGSTPSVRVNPAKAPIQETTPIYEPAPSSEEDDFELDESKLFEN